MEALSLRLRGRLILPNDDLYDHTRKVWNSMINKYPAAIAMCTGVADVIHCVNFARENRVRIAIRCGHNVAGLGVCDNGLVIDLSLMRNVVVNPSSMTARVGAGATLGDVDHETQAFGLVVPLGVNSTTGISGLTLGGGVGWLTRKLGMTVDHLLSAEVVLANGEYVTCSQEQLPDLFWALRGGGGNFGVVTSFEFNLVPLGPRVLAGPIVFPWEEMAQVLGNCRDWLRTVSPDVNTIWISRIAPPFPFLPASCHGRPVVMIVVIYTGPVPEEGSQLIKQMHAFGTVLGSHVDIVPFTGWQKSLDASLAPGMRNYLKSLNFTDMTDEAIHTLSTLCENFPSPYCELMNSPLGAVASSVPVDATSYGHRDAKYLVNVHARWEKPEDDAVCIAWARKVCDSMLPYSAGSTYINFSTDALSPSAAFGENAQRLVDVKTRYDPENLFQVNHNILPRQQNA